MGRIRTEWRPGYTGLQISARRRDGSFVIGGRGSYFGQTSRRRFDRLRDYALALFPGLESAEWVDAWSGKVAMTADHVPHLHNPEAGLFCVVGCNGRGIALATVIGTMLGDVFAQGGIDRVRHPMPVVPIRPIPLHRLHKLGVATIGTFYQVMDNLESGRRRA